MNRACTLDGPRIAAESYTIRNAITGETVAENLDGIEAVEAWWAESDRGGKWWGVSVDEDDHVLWVEAVTPDDERQHAREAGYESCLQGARNCSNPHTAGTALYDAWGAGWEQGMDTLRDKELFGV